MAIFNSYLKLPEGTEPPFQGRLFPRRWGELQVPSVSGANISRTLRWLCASQKGWTPLLIATWGYVLYIFVRLNLVESGVFPDSWYSFGIPSATRNASGGSGEGGPLHVEDDPHNDIFLFFIFPILESSFAQRLFALNCWWLQRCKSSILPVMTIQIESTNLTRIFFLKPPTRRAWKLWPCSLDSLL